VRIAASVDGPVTWVTQVIALRLNLSSGSVEE
jgi:general secretion pathway protein J